MKEYRKFKRLEFRQPLETGAEAEFDRDAQASSPEASGFVSCDISQGGMRFYSNEFLPLQKEMRLSFFVGSERKVALAGKVVWIQKVPHAETYQVGLEFDNTLSDPLANQDLCNLLES